MIKKIRLRLCSRSTPMASADNVFAEELDNLIARYKIRIQ